jgi:hypothetical protein
MICAKHTSDLKKRQKVKPPRGLHQLVIWVRKNPTAQILLPELQSSRGIEWKFHVAPSLETTTWLLVDMLTDLGIDIRFSEQRD